MPFAQSRRISSPLEPFSYLSLSLSFSLSLFLSLSLSLSLSLFHPLSLSFTLSLSLALCSFSYSSRQKYLDALRVKDLQDILTSLRMPKSGRKDELVKRLKDMCRSSLMVHHLSLIHI